MLHLKRQRSSDSFQNFKDVCPRCTRSMITVKKRNSPKLLTYYKRLCRSSKCFIHGVNYPVRIKKKSGSKTFLCKNSKTQKISQINTCDVPFIVDEFEEEANSLDNIDIEMYTKIESSVEDFDEASEIYFRNLVGYRNIKNIINRTIIWPLKKPEIFKGLRSAPSGVLFFGPPGTGKTSLAKFIASKTNSTFFNISASILSSKWMGDSEKLVRTLFLVAKARQPSIIFIDEIDSIFSERIGDENDCGGRMKSEFLFCMNAIDAVQENRIMVIGATSRPQKLDETVRPRFLKRIYIPLPDENVGDRKDILSKLLECECHSLEEIDINDIVKKTVGYSVADLKNLSQEAAMGPIKALAGCAIIRLKADKIRPISMEDFFWALELIKPTVSEEQVKSCENWDSLYGYGGEENSN